MERAQGFAIVRSSTSTPASPAPSCTVTVYNAGTVVLATIYADDGVTPKANPFTADVYGFWFFYASNGHYDVMLSGGGIPAPYTLADILLLDSASGFIGTLNGLTANIQLLVTGTAGTDFAIVSAVDTHTFNIPDAGIAARGLVRVGAQSFAGAKTFTTPIDEDSGGTGGNYSAAGNGKLLIGNGAGFTLANLTQGANASVAITNGAGSIALDTIQDIRTTAEPTFGGLILTNPDGGLSPLLRFSAFAGTPSGSVPVVDNVLGDTFIVPLVDKQVIMGVTGSVPTATNLVEGLGIRITYATPDLTIENSGIRAIDDGAGHQLFDGDITFATGTSGTDVGFLAGATTMTLNVPDAGASARGVVTTGAQSIAGVKTFLDSPKVIPGSAANSSTPGRVVVGILPNVAAANVGNVGAGEDNLRTTTLAGGSLDLDGLSRVRIKAWGIVAANANSKTIKLYFGATVIATLTNATTLNDGPWVLEADVVRVGSTSQESIGEGRSKCTGASAAAFTVTSQTRSNPAETLANDIVIKVTGEAVADNDIINTGLIVEIL